MKKSMVFLIGFACFFAGVGLGFMISPAKNGMGNNCGNNTNNYWGKEPDDGDEFDEPYCEE